MDGDRKIVITVELTPDRAIRFVNLVRRAADLCTTREDLDFWRSLANRVIDQCVGLNMTSRRWVWRPPDDDEVALKRVIDGVEPYPMLSRMDARRAVIALGDKLSARELGHRLYMDQRTASQWRASYNKGEWKKYGL
jgi:hypothetical protein